MGWGRRWCGLVRRFALGLVRRFALGLAVLLCSSCALAQACLPQILSIQSAKAAGLGPAPLGDTTLQWHNVTLPDHWLDRWPGYSGAVWYRIDWQRGCAHPHATPADPVALALHSMVMAGEVFVNGDLLWRDRHLAEPLSRSWNMPRFWLLPESALHAGTNSVWIRVHGLAEQTPGLGEVRLGEPEALRQWHEQTWWNQRTLFTMNIVVSAVLGVLFGFAWLQRRASKAFGWYALNAFCWALFLANILATEAWPFPDTLAVARGNLLVFVLFSLSFCLFTWRFGGLRLPRLEKLLWALSLAGMAAAVFAPWPLVDGALPVGLVFFGICVATSLHFPLHAWRTREAGHLVYAACLLVFLAAGLHDMLVLKKVLDASVPWMPYTAPLTMLALSMVLGRQFMLGMRRIEQFNQELTDSVARACDELGSTLAREHALALSHSRLQERLQLAHDLHDSLGGSLVRSIAMVEQAGSPLHNRQFLSMLKLLRDDLRQMIDSGPSVSVTQAWIAPLRHRFASLFDALDMQSDWQVPAAWPQPPGALPCLALTRVLEEALANVVKHSRAQCVQVELQWPEPHWLVLRITDDGAGFDVAAVQQAGMGVGLRSMQARLQRLGGHLDMDSEPGATVLAAWLPLPGGQPPGSTAQGELSGKNALSPH
jgi:signal transduction histidine kinase